MTDIRLTGTDPDWLSAMLACLALLLLGMIATATGVAMTYLLVTA